LRSSWPESLNEGHGKERGRALGSGEAAAFPTSKSAAAMYWSISFVNPTGTRRGADRCPSPGGLLGASAREAATAFELFLDVSDLPATATIFCPRTIQGEQNLARVFDRADAVSACGDQNNRCGGIEASMFSRGGFFPRGLQRVDRRGFP